MTHCVVLDAMGVMFSAGDDVAELLVPFVQRAKPSLAAGVIESTYSEASLGAIGADDFWTRLGLDPRVEDHYLGGHSLVPGVVDFLQGAKNVGMPVWCLSNDVDRWSRKLRSRFGIEDYLEGSVISSAVQARKPDSAIYTHLLNSSGFKPETLLFVDDRQKNVEAAARLGIPAVHFSVDAGYEGLKRLVLESAGQQPHATIRGR
jgi:HAD superfamily hydrolase (TIGR01549 family)